MSAKATARRRVELEGELTIFTAAQQHERLRLVLEADSDLRLGLSGVTGLDTAGLQVLMLARNEASRRGFSLTFCEPSSSVTDVLAIAQLDGEFDEARTGAELET